MKHLFIINPVAGGKDQRLEIMGAASGALHARGETDYAFYVTRGPMDAVEKIRAAAAEAAGAGTELRVYACGGDGTLNECCNGAAGLPHVAVTQYPCGTGNDFIKQFGADKALFSQIGRLLDGEVRPLDLIFCNGRYSVNICSVGVGRPDRHPGPPVQQPAPGGGRHWLSGECGGELDPGDQSAPHHRHGWRNALHWGLCPGLRLQRHLVRRQFQTLCRRPAG